MKELNLQYEQKLKSCNGQTSKDSEGKDHVYRYDEVVENELVEKICQLLELQMEGVNILLIGIWIWVLGDTKPYKDGLKRIGCRWHTKRGCWYFATHKGRYFSNGNQGLNELADRYGCQEIKEVKKTKRHKLA